MDASLRELERRSRTTQAPEDEVAYLRALAQAGHRDGVTLAAYCGVATARVALGTTGSKGRSALMPRFDDRPPEANRAAIIRALLPWALGREDPVARPG